MSPAFGEGWLECRREVHDLARAWAGGGWSGDQLDAARAQFGRAGRRDRVHRFLRGPIGSSVQRERAPHGCSRGRSGQVASAPLPVAQQILLQVAARDIGQLTDIASSDVHRTEASRNTRVGPLPINPLRLAAPRVAAYLRSRGRHRGALAFSGTCANYQPGPGASWLGSVPSR